MLWSHRHKHVNNYSGWSDHEISALALLHPSTGSQARDSLRLGQRGGWHFRILFRAVTTILKCQVNTTRRRGIKVVLSFLYREEKSSCHVAMVTKFFWMSTNWKYQLKSEFAPVLQTSINLIQFHFFVKYWQNFLGLNLKGPYLC